MQTTISKIRQATSRDEIITVLADAGINFNAPVGLLMREARRNKEFVKLDLIHLANQRIQGMKK